MRQIIEYVSRRHRFVLAERSRHVQRKPGNAFKMQIPSKKTTIPEAVGVAYKKNSMKCLVFPDKNLADEMIDGFWCYQEYE
jgi:hypothetical protein